MLRFAALACLAACSVAAADPDPVTLGQPLTLEDLRSGGRFYLHTTWQSGIDERTLPEFIHSPVWPEDLLSAAPAIGVDLSIELDASWPGRRLAIAPHFPLSRAFEGAGDSWTALCTSRRRAYASDAHEILAYLGAWCEMRTNTHAVHDLVALSNARAPGLASAVRDDVADFLADGRPASQAIAWLEEHRVASPDALEALATSYAASDQRDESRAVFHSLDARDPSAPAATACRRLQHIAAIAPNEQTDIEKRILALASRGDPTCTRIVAPVRCREEIWRHAPATCDSLNVDGALAADLDRCRPYLAARPGARPAVSLFALRGYWPPYFSHGCPWQRIGELASRSLDIPGAEDFALAAFGNAMLESDCGAPARAAIAKVARAIARDSSHTASHDAQIAELAQMTELECWRYRR
jgi:hypothetical protein